MPNHISSHTINTHIIVSFLFGKNLKYTAIDV